MKVSFHESHISFEVKEPSGARIDKFISNINDVRQGIAIIKILQEKYGFLEGFDIVKKKLEEKEKKFVDL